MKMTMMRLCKKKSVVKKEFPNFFFFLPSNYNLFIHLFIYFASFLLQKNKKQQQKQQQQWE